MLLFYVCCYLLFISEYLVSIPLDVCLQCANCLKEAIYYCCWNTSYCSYDCQQTHWPTHLPSCMQTQSTTGPATATTTSIPKTTGVTPLGAGTSGSGFDSDVIVMSASLGPTKVKGVDNAEKLQVEWLFFSP